MFNSAINALSTKTGIGLSLGIALFAPPGVVQKVALAGAVIGGLGRLYNFFNTKKQPLTSSITTASPQAPTPAPVAPNHQDVKKSNASLSPPATPNPSATVASNPQIRTVTALTPQEPTPQTIGNPSPSGVALKAPPAMRAPSTPIDTKPTQASKSITHETNQGKIVVGKKNVVLYSIENNPTFSDKSYHTIYPTSSSYNEAGLNTGQRKLVVRKANVEEALTLYSYIEAQKKTCRYDEIAILLSEKDRESVVEQINLMNQVSAWAF